MFTGDRSGDWLYRALHRAGFATTPESVSQDDGLRLTNAYITAPVRCAPPANRPTPEERDNCSSWFDAELKMLPDVRVIVCLGQYAYAATSAALARSGAEVPSPRPKFGHGVEVRPNGGPGMLLSFHPSQQNTFTGKLTEPMLDAVFARARGLTNRR